VLILESDPSRPYSVLYRYHFGQLLGRVSLESALEEFLEAEGDEDGDGVDSYPFALRGHDMAFVPDRVADADLVLGTLYIVASDGNQSFAFRLMADRLTKVLGPDQAALSLELLPRYFPMRLFSGKALVAADGDVYYDLDEQWLSLVEHRRPRYRVTGLLETAAFDGREPDCVWHRLFLDACIPNGTEVRVESRAANSLDLLNQMAWQSEPRLYRRSGGPELPYYQYADPGEAGEGDKGTWELLFQRARGRYLQLRLTLRGTGRATPRLFALRAYYPRFSYLKEYLPAAYQVDETSASFLERFLANVEGTYTVLEGRIAQVQTLFDVGSAPAEYLEWLASWFGVVLDPNWDEARRRLFLSHVIELFNQRGTLAGLVRSVRLATDPCPDDSLFEEDVLALSTGGGACTPRARMARRTVRIVERFLTRSAPGVVFGDPTQAVGPGVSTGISDWTPDQGAEPLHQEFRAYLREQYADITALNQAWGPGSDYPSFAAITFPPVNPANDAKAADWQLFLQTRLGFTYAVVEAADQKSYQEFLARRHQHVERLNNAYQLTGERAVATFDAIALPEEDDMPSSSPRLYDWIQFVSLVLPIRRYAHRFSVLVPTDPQNTPDEVSRQLDLVRRVVELEKPAHTDFEVAPYWALFRVGEVRLGLDTLLGEGSRFIAIVLGQTYLSQSYLEASHPWDVTKRVIADRDRLGAMPSL
jgi:phage tail-like protein